jgi:hypothetical protein
MVKFYYNNNIQNMKKISTSALSKILNTDWKEFIKLLEENWYIEIKNKSLFSSDRIKILTLKWKENWWEMKTWTKFWDYIIWPENFNPFNSSNVEYISVSVLAEGFWYWARKMNQIISELWWIEPNLKWWKLTKFWEKIWGKEFLINKTWATYTKWPISIKENPSLLSSIWQKNTNSNKVVIKEKKIKNSKELNFREKFPAQYRTKDWHNVRSRWELVIDNSLYEYWLAHAYERKLPIEEDVYSDFYIPAKDWWKAVYIEYWGIEDQEKYENRKKIKKEIYKKYHMNLIELENKHIDNLDDFLPRMLLEYWIRVD